MPRTRKPLPSLATLNYLLELRDGALYWRISTGRSLKGSRAGGVCKKDGHRTITVDGANYLEHRIVYYMHHGIDPGEMTVEHIDGNKENNSPDNLQLVTWSKTVRKRSEKRPAGVYRWFNKYHARIRYMGTLRYLGSFATKEEAIAARQAAELRYFGKPTPTRKRPML